MYKVKFKFPDREYMVYKKKEADKACIEYKHWKLCNAGDWALSDDDYVFQVIRHTIIDYLGRGNKPTKAHLYIFPFGKFKWVEMYANTKYKVDGRGRYDAEAKYKRVKNKLSGRETKDLAMVYSMLWDIEATIEVVSPERSFMQKRALAKNMKTKVFRDMVAKEVRVLMEENGLGKSYVVSLLQEVVALAKEKKDARILLSVAENLQKLNGMDDKEKTTVTETLSLRGKAQDFIGRVKQEKDSAGKEEVEGRYQVEEEGREMVRAEETESVQEETPEANRE